MAKQPCDRLSEQTRNAILGNPCEIIASAERRFTVRIRIAVPPTGLGRRHPQITAWLDESCGADGWAMTPSGTRGGERRPLDLFRRCHPRERYAKTSAVSPGTLISQLLSFSGSLVISRTTGRVVNDDHIVRSAVDSK
jgi:hypothetical protein